MPQTLYTHFFQMPMLHNESHHITKHAHHLDLSHHWSWIDLGCDPNFYNNWWVPFKMLGLLLSISNEWLSLISGQHVLSRQSSIWRCSLLMITNEIWTKCLVSASRVKSWSNEPTLIKNSTTNGPFLNILIFS
jgi:hypothetical protein